MTTHTVLVVEDHAEIRDLILLLLAREGYTVTAAARGDEAIQLISQRTFDLLVLDWMLPGSSGLEIMAQRTRGPNATTPVLMVTAKSTSEDIVAGLEAGADDYVTKPFEPNVLLARCKALLRRIGTMPTTASQEITAGGLTIRPEKFEAYCQGEQIILTKFEFKLLLAMAMQPGKVHTRDQLIDKVQGEGIVVIDRTVDTHVFGLRKKLKNCAALIETIRGVGYRMKS